MANSEQKWENHSRRSGRGGGSYRRGQRYSKPSDQFQSHADGRRNEKDVDESSPVIQVFRSYQIELDAKHDKYERLVKKSRDITIESKRVIFLLHRISGKVKKEEILQEATNRLTELHHQITKGIGSELIHEDMYHYVRAFSPGLQEFVEALTFYFYLKDGRLISLKEIHEHSALPEQAASDEKSEVPTDTDETGLPMSTLLTPIDYILGVADCTGELMRKCITSVGSGDLEEPFVLCNVLQSIYDAFSVIGNLAGRDLFRKTQVLKSSLQKVENACYAIRVRGTETPKHMLADFFSQDAHMDDVSGEVYACEA